jgi:hypothetical protein
VFAGANDTINLGNARDTVAFGVSSGPPIGNEVVNGFGKHDVIEFNGSLFTNYAAMLRAGDIVQSGANTVTSDHAGDTVTLVGVTAASLSPHNFRFLG